MKNLLKVAAFVLLSSSFTMAAEPNPVKENDVKMNLYFDYVHGKIKTFFENNSGEDLKVSISDNFGNEMASSKLNKRNTKARINFDINNLSDGQYVIKVSSKNGLEDSKKVTLSTMKPVKKLSY